MSGFVPSSYNKQVINYSYLNLLDLLVNGIQLDKTTNMKVSNNQIKLIIFKCEIKANN